MAELNNLILLLSEKASKLYECKDMNQIQVNRLDFLQTYNIVNLNQKDDLTQMMEGQVLQVELEYLMNQEPQNKKKSQNQKGLADILSFSTFQQYQIFNLDKLIQELQIKIQEKQKLSGALQEIERLRKELQTQQMMKAKIQSAFVLDKKQTIQEEKENQEQEVSESENKQKFMVARNMLNNKKRQNTDDNQDQNQVKKFKPPSKVGAKIYGEQAINNKAKEVQQQQDPRLKGIDPNLIERIESEILSTESITIDWTDIAGLNHVKSLIEEVALWPLINPELFNGITQPGKGLLLFGPPGTGKTMIGKAIANDAKATFFSISASSLTSKWIGEGEKLVKTLFVIAHMRQPSVIFIDEVDSILCARSDKENEASRLIKTEFLVQLEGAHRTGNERILFIGATNRPQELDDAIRRRFQKKLYIPLANAEGREQQITIINQKEQLRGKKTKLSAEDLQTITKLTKGYSGADIKNLCTEAYMIPIREAIKNGITDVKLLKPDQVRPIKLNDFVQAIKSVKATVSQKELDGYVEWNKTYGSFNYDLDDLQT